MSTIYGEDNDCNHSVFDYGRLSMSPYPLPSSVTANIGHFSFCFKKGTEGEYEATSFIFGPRGALCETGLSA
jgi:hypothetical protein